MSYNSDSRNWEWTDCWRSVAAPCELSKQVSGLLTLWLSYQCSVISWRWLCSAPCPMLLLSISQMHLTMSVMEVCGMTLVSEVFKVTCQVSVVQDWLLLALWGNLFFPDSNISQMSWKEPPSADLTLGEPLGFLALIQQQTCGVLSTPQLAFSPRGVW